MIDLSRENTKAAALLTSEVLGTSAESEFDRLTEIAANLLKVPTALLTFFEAGQPWTKSHFGAGTEPSPTLTALYSQTMRQTEPLVVLNVPGDDRFAETGTKSPIGFYAGIAIVSADGEPIGALCVTDGKRRRDFADSDLAFLRQVAGLAAALVNAKRRVAMVELTTDRALASNGLSAAILQSRDLDVGLDGAMRALAKSHHAIFGELWCRPSGQNQLVRFNSWGIRSNVLGDAIDRRETGLLASAMRRDHPIGIVLSAAGEFARDPMVREAAGEGLRQLLAIPFHAGDTDHVIVLGFNQTDPTFALTMRDMPFLHALLRPAVAHKAEEDRARLLGVALDQAADGITILQTHRAGKEDVRRIVYVNKSICRMTGFSADEMIGQTTEILCGPETNADDLYRFRRGYSLGQPMAARIVNYRKDRTTFMVDVEMSPIPNPNGPPNRFVVVHRDVSKQQRAERELQQVSDSFRLMFEESPLPMWAFDAKTLQFLMVNEAAVRFYGWSREEFLHKSLHDVCIDEVLDAMALAGMRSMNDHGVFTHQRADGTRMIMAGATRSHSIKGRDAVLTALWDISAQKSNPVQHQRCVELLNKLTEEPYVPSAELTEEQLRLEVTTRRMAGMHEVFCEADWTDWD